MQDRPDARTLLAEVQAALKAGIAPGFQQARAANAVALALRETGLAPATHDAEHARLVALLGREGDLAVLNRMLAHGIRDGSIDCGQAGLSDHLIRTTIEKLAVDQPNYPAFRAWRASLGDDE